MQVTGGVLAPLVNPCREDDSLDFPALEAQLSRLLDSKVDGIYLNGGTGDAANLTQEERLRIAAYAVPRLRARQKCAVVQVGQTSLRCALALTEQAAALHADAVASVPPQKDFAQVRSYYEALTQVGVPVLVYYIPSMTGKAASYEELCELLRLPGVLGIKVSDWNLFLVRRLKRAFPEKVVFEGLDELLLPGILYGADGCIGTWVNLLPDFYATVFAHAKNGEAEAVLPLTQRFAAFLTLAWDYGVLNTFEELMCAKGFAQRCFRKPGTWTPGSVPPDVLQKLFAELSALEEMAKALS